MSADEFLFESRSIAVPVSESDRQIDAMVVDPETYFREGMEKAKAEARRYVDRQMQKRLGHLAFTSNKHLEDNASAA